MDNQSAGTVTFLFTDIEGSTKLWEHYPDAMKIALARHDDILRQAVELHGGRVIKTVGDSFYTVFESAMDALEAALTAQRALYTEDWGEVGAIRARMALHAGVAEEREGEYFGSTISHILGLMNVGHGGQILLSKATQELIRDQLPLSAQLRDLGHRRLRDLTSSEHIFQVTTPYLPADFPPLRTLDLRPTNLPAQPTALIGRELEVAAACAFLRRQDVRLLTLTGPSGIGKTRLGLQVAADMLEEFENGAFFVPLGAICDSSLVAAIIAQTLAIRETTSRSLTACITACLADKQLLLVLDNFEQLLGAAALVTDLLAAAPRLKALVTSRAVLHAPGEHRFLVPPLALPKPNRLPPLNVLSQYAAVALFIERAQAVKPDFALTEDNAAAVVNICARLDRLPLAIELAAARSKLLSPRAILERLDHRLALLTAGARDLPPRQRTMRDAIAWSYDLLEASEQALFRKLAIFVGGCTIKAVEAVMGAPPEAMIALLDKSLVRQAEMYGGQPRFIMLETIREYALEQLGASEPEQQAQALRQRHASYFLQLAQEAESKLIGPEQIMWIETLEAEHDNLRAAIEWCQASGRADELCLHLAGALWRFWYLRGYWSEGRQYLEKALRAPGAFAPSTWRAKALYGAGELARFHGDEQTAQHYLDESLALWQQLGDTRGQAYVLVALGTLHVSKGNRSAARALLAESVRLFRECGDQWGLALSLRGLGTATEPGDDQTARSLFEASLRLFKEINDRWGLARSLGNLGFLAYRQNDYATARQLYEESLSIFRQVGDKWLIADALNVLGEVARCQADYARAARVYEESLALFRDLGSKNGIATSLHNLGYIALHQGNVDKAAELFFESLKVEQELRRSDVSLHLVGLAAIALRKEQVKSSTARPEHSQQVAQLLGAAEALFEASQLVLDPADHAEYDGLVAALRACLDTTTFAQAWAKGRALTQDQVFALALELAQK